MVVITMTMLEDRRRNKQASRDRDAEDLRTERKTRAQLREENGVVKIKRIHWAEVKAPR